jgi:hypothetical protein
MSTLCGSSSLSCFTNLFNLLRLLKVSLIAHGNLPMVLPSKPARYRTILSSSSILIATPLPSQRNMQTFLLTINVLLLCMSTMLQLTLIREFVLCQTPQCPLSTELQSRIRGYKLGRGSNISSIVMSRYMVLAPTCDPFVGFRCDFSKNGHDLTGIGACVNTKGILQLGEVCNSRE